MDNAIIKDWLNTPIVNKQQYSFNFITITNKKKADFEIIRLLQENLLYTYEDKESLDFSLDGGDKTFIREYLKSLFPNDENSDSENNKRMTQSGDFGEATTKLLLKHLYNKDSVNKLKYKLHSGRSVFGTDLISFDNINNPSTMSFCEIKTRQKLQKEKGKNEQGVEESLYISVIAHNSLKYDTKQIINPVLRFMMVKAKESKELDTAKTFREIINGNKKIKKEYEIYILTEDTKANLANILDALEQLQNKLFPLSITFIIVDDLDYIKKEIWSGIENYAYSLYGVEE